MLRHRSQLLVTPVICKNMPVRLLTLSLLLCGALFGACNQPEPSSGADIVLLNGGIYTVDAERSWAEAAAILDGRIVAVGSNASVEALLARTRRSLTSVVVWQCPE